MIFLIVILVMLIGEDVVGGGDVPPLQGHGTRPAARRGQDGARPAGGQDGDRPAGWRQDGARPAAPPSAVWRGASYSF